MRSLGTRLDPPIVALEIGGYIGVPLLLLSGFFVWRSRRSPRMQLAVILLLGAALLSLGPHLAVDGHVTGVPLPFLVLDKLPLLKNILPSRIDFALGACMGAVVAFGLDDKRREESEADQSTAPQRAYALRAGSSILAGLTLVVLVGTQLPQWPQQQPFAAQPDSTLPQRIAHAVPHGDPVALTYPYAIPSDVEPLLWQAQDDFAFRILGGYAKHAGANGHPTGWPNTMSPAGLQKFLLTQEYVYGLQGSALQGHGGSVTPVDRKLVTVTRSTVDRYHVRLVIVDRTTGGSGPVMKLLTRALGPPKVSTDRFALWTPRPRCRSCRTT
jgi:hypothetical protein